MWYWGCRHEELHAVQKKGVISYDIRVIFLIVEIISEFKNVPRKLNEK